MALLTYIFVILILNALLGVYMFEWAWKKVGPVRRIDKQRDSQFPPFRRVDVEQWSKAKFYLQAVTVMPFRFCVGVWVLATLFIYVK